MSNTKREWIPCRICEHYYNEECDNKVISNCKFKPTNDFIQFLSNRNLRLSEYDNYLSPTIYFVNDNYVIPNDNTYIDLRDKSIDDILLFISKTKFGKKIILPIEEEYRNAIYNNEWVMKYYHIKMLLSKEFSKKDIKYKLDQRFSIEYY